MKIIHSTRSEIKTPLLIDKTQLDTLRVVLADEWSRWMVEYDKSLNHEIDVRLKKDPSCHGGKERNPEVVRESLRKDLMARREFRIVKNYIVNLRKGDAVSFDDFDSLLRSPFLIDKEVRGLKIHQEAGLRSCEITISDSECEIDVNPSLDVFAQQTYTVLRNWQSDISPSWWLRLWDEWHGIALLIWFIVWAILSNAHDKKSESQGMKTAIASAYDIVKTGVSDVNRDKALELILIKQYGYSGVSVVVEYGWWYYIVVVGGFFYSCLLFVKPKIAVGIGVGERKVWLWRRYIKFMAITLPVFVFTTFFWPRVMSLFSV